MKYPEGWAKLLEEHDGNVTRAAQAWRERHGEESDEERGRGQPPQSPYELHVEERARFRFREAVERRKAEGEGPAKARKDGAAREVSAWLEEAASEVKRVASWALSTIQGKAKKAHSYLPEEEMEEPEVTLLEKEREKRRKRRGW